MTYRVPTRKDIEAFAQHDERYFGNWLQRSLAQYFHHKKHRHAFKPLQSFIGQGQGIVGEVAAIYRLMNDHQQGAFRWGLALAYSHTDDLPENIPVLETLLQLALGIAAWEAVHAIADKQRVRWLVDECRDDELFDAAVRTLEGLARAGSAEHGERLADALHSFIGHPDFPAAYAEPVLIALCRVDPDHSFAHLVALRRHLDPELGKTEDDSLNDARAPIRRRLVESMSVTMGQRPFQRLLNDALETRLTVDRDWWFETACLVGAPPDYTLPARDLGRQRPLRSVGLPKIESTAAEAGDIGATYLRNFPSGRSPTTDDTGGGRS